MTVSRLYLAFALSILACCNYATLKDKKAVQKITEIQHIQYENDSKTIALAELKVKNSYDTIITVQHAYFHNDWICKKNGIYTLYESKLTYKLKPKEGYFRRPVKISKYSFDNFDTVINLLKQFKIDTITTDPKIDTTTYCDHCWGSRYIIVINNDTLLSYYENHQLLDTLHPKHILSKAIDEKLNFHHAKNEDAR